MLRARTMKGATGVIFGPREHPNILGNKAALVDILRKQGNGWMDGYFVYRRSTLKGHIASNKFYAI